MTIALGALACLLITQLAVSLSVLKRLGGEYGAGTLMWSAFGATVLWIALLASTPRPCLIRPEMAFLFDGALGAGTSCTGGGVLLAFFYAYSITGLTILGIVIGSSLSIFRATMA